MKIKETLALTLETLPVNEDPATVFPSPLDELVVAPQSSPASQVGPMDGDVVGARDPARPGRARVRWLDADGTEREQWLRTMAHVSVRPGDRVLLVQPVRWSEPLVTGVIDGFSMRLDAELVPAATLSLQPDESVRVSASDGTPLVEVFQSDAGPVVRLCQPNVSIELPGKLRIDAKSIELNAKQGGVAIRATDEVVVQGEAVRLN